MPPQINSRGESGQDFWAFAQCGWKLNGTFLDIGSNEPVRWNNTFALEEVGCLVDIEPSFGPACRAQRKSQFICADARTINWRQLFHTNNPSMVMGIDYLSLDIDENENRDLAITILENMFAEGLIFDCATIEHDGYRYGDNPRLKIRERMLRQGYTLARADVEIGQFRAGNGVGNGKPFEDWWVR